MHHYLDILGGSKMHPLGETGKRGRSTFSVPMSTLAIGGILISITCLASLVIVVSIKKVDELSTVALALAILAFVVQLIVFIVQTASASEQSLQAQQLNASTIQILTQLQERMQGTEQSLERMNSELLSAALGKSIPQLEAEGVGVNAEYFDKLADSITKIMTSNVNEYENARRIPVAGVLAPPLRDDEADSLRSYMERWTEPNEVDEVIETLRSLSPDLRHRLARMAADVIRFTERGSEVGPGFLGVPSDQLVKAGLVTSFLVDGNNFYTLSPKGRKVARVVTAIGPTPDYIPDELLGLVSTSRVGGSMQST